MTTEPLYNKIFAQIIDGSLPPGTWLKEETLAREFGMSRTPIRQALRELASDGLLEIQRNRGARVIALTADDVEELYDIRKALELLVLDFCLERIRLSTLKKLESRIQHLRQAESPELHAELDRELHASLLEAANRPRLAKALEQQLRLMQRFRYLGFQDPLVTQQVCEEHLQLLEALYRRDLDRAKDVMTEHIEASKFRVLQHL